MIPKAKSTVFLRVSRKTPTMLVQPPGLLQHEQKGQIWLIKFRARWRSLTEAVIERENAVQKNRCWWFLVQWGTFLDRILAFDASGGTCFLGRVISSNFLYKHNWGYHCCNIASAIVTYHE